MRTGSKAQYPTAWTRTRIVLPCALAYLAAYWCVDHWHGKAHFLPMTELDDRIPFLVWTIWPYLALDFAAAFLPIFIRDRNTLFETLHTCGVAIAICMATWIIYPTIYPRPALPTGNAWSELVYDWFRSFDGPANCLPSGHIVVPFLAIWGLARDRASWRPWLWGCLALATPTLLTLKQHYIVDLVAGYAVALGSIMMVKAWTQISLARRARASHPFRGGAHAARNHEGLAFEEVAVPAAPQTHRGARRRSRAAGGAGAGPN